uniref:Tf2-1-like SH3-like domain-containing protein n=1 Tax=Peronospora matthiolae TaxID=2874970 RepID=A0AAV1T255_9STRA
MGVDVMDANVDAIDIDDDDVDDAGIFGIANDCHSEEDDAPTGADNVLSALRMKRTAVDTGESAEKVLLTREAEKNADKRGRANALSFDQGDLVSLSTVNLPKIAVTKLGSSRLLPKCIGPFRVLRRIGNAYTIKLPRRMRTHPTLYAGRLRPYYQFEPVSRCEEHLCGKGPRPLSSGPVSTSQSGRIAKRPVHAAQRCLDEQQPAHHEENESNIRSQVARTQTRHDRPNDRAFGNCNYPLQDPEAHDAESVHEPGHLATVSLHGSALEHQADPTLEPDQVFPPSPHPSVDFGGGQCFLVERIFNHRDVIGVRTS